MEKVFSYDTRFTDIQMIEFLESWISADSDATICTIKPKLMGIFEIKPCKMTSTNR